MTIAWKRKGLRIHNEGKQVALCDYCPCGNFLAFQIFSSSAYKSNSVRSWTQVYNPSFRSIVDVATNGEYWIVAGNQQTDSGAYFAKSYDRVSWTENYVDTGTAGSFISWNGSFWIAVANGYLGTKVTPDVTPKILKSIDGESWTIYDLDDYELIFDPVWNGSYFLASASKYDGVSRTYYILKSSDGIYWSEFDSPSKNTTLASKTYNGFLWVSTGSDGVYTSTDGINWTIRVSQFYRHFEWNGEYFLAFNQGGRIVKSYDGITWEDTDKTFFGFGNDLIWNGNYWLALGSTDPLFEYTALSKSRDGETWKDYKFPYRDARKIASIPRPNIYPPIL